MTAVVELPADLAHLEFDIPCEARGCDNPAYVMCKGCSDARHAAICKEHLAGVRRRFESKGVVVCSGCERPWLHFETHYDLTEIRSGR